MPGTGAKHPRPACVEDWDDDAQTTLSSTRATANAAVKRAPAGRGAGPGQLTYIRDGSDSGYSSKAGTIASTSTNKTNGKRPRNLTVNTSIIERKPQPYSMTPQPQSNASRHSHDKPSGARHAQPSAKGERFKHPPTVCWVCDQLGYHLDANELARLTHPPTPTSPKANKKASKAEQEAQKRLHRLSLTRESRPTVVYPPLTTPNFYPVTSGYPPSSIGTPITPQLQMPYAPGETVYAYAPVTPIQYVVEPGQSDYFRPQPAEKDRPSKTNRLSNIYDYPVIHHSRPQEAKATNSASSQEARPTIKSHPSNRSTDQQRADREAMPPPPGRPKQKSIKRSSSRDPAAYTTDDIDDRYSRTVDLPKPRASTRESSPIRESRAPPSAYKHVEQAGGTTSRPHMRNKSVSYSDPITTTQVAVSPSVEASTSHRRRNTTSSDRSASHDRQAADAEAYIQQRKSRLTAEQLTAEKIAEMKISKHVVSSRSETGSTFSQHSHQSSSKSSSGRDRSHTRGRRTSILIDGIKVEIPQEYLDRKGRPLSVQLPGVNISVGNKDKSTSADRRDHKLIEKAPSVASHRSKRSVTDSSHSSSKAKGKHRDDGERVIRQAPHTSDARPPSTGNNPDYSVYGA